MLGSPFFCYNGAFPKKNDASTNAHVYEKRANKRYRRIKVPSPGSTVKCAAVAAAVKREREIKLV